MSTNTEESGEIEELNAHDAYLLMTILDVHLHQQQSKMSLYEGSGLTERTEAERLAKHIAQVRLLSQKIAKVSKRWKGTPPVAD